MADLVSALKFLCVSQYERGLSRGEGWRLLPLLLSLSTLLLVPAKLHLFRLAQKVPFMQLDRCYYTIHYTQVNLMLSRAPAIRCFNTLICGMKFAAKMHSSMYICTHSHTLHLAPCLLSTALLSIFLSFLKTRTHRRLPLATEPRCVPWVCSCYDVRWIQMQDTNKR